MLMAAIRYMIIFNLSTIPVCRLILLDKSERGCSDSADGHGPACQGRTTAFIMELFIPFVLQNQMHTESLANIWCQYL